LSLRIILSEVDSLPRVLILNEPLTTRRQVLSSTQSLLYSTLTIQFLLLREQLFRLCERLRRTIWIAREAALRFETREVGKPLL
jgi:hypothetical protein